MTNILDDNEFSLDDFNPKAIADKISNNFKIKRLQLNITQKELAQKSGVSLGSVKRFETQSEISLKHLLMLALVVDSSNDFLGLFTKTSYENIEEVKQAVEKTQRIRARK